MKLVACLLVYRIFEFTAALKSKSVNLALETVLEFDNKDNPGDVQFINNVQTFLDKVKTFISEPNNGRRNFNDDEETFTGFLQKAIEILVTYEDDDLEDVVAVLDNELRKYHYKGCKFYKLIENIDVRRNLAKNLYEIRNTPSKLIKKRLLYIKKILADSKSDGEASEFLDYINSLYNTDAQKKFRRFLSNLEQYQFKSKRANLDLIQMIREGVRSIIFDHYTDLNKNAREDLKLKIESFFNRVKGDVHEIWDIANMKNYSITDASAKPFLKSIPIKISTREEDSIISNEHIVKKKKKIKKHKVITDNVMLFFADTVDTTQPIKKDKYHNRFIGLYPEEITTKKTQKKRKPLKQHHKAETKENFDKHGVKKEKIKKKKTVKPKKKIYKTIVTENELIIDVKHTTKAKHSHAHSHGKTGRNLRRRKHHKPSTNRKENARRNHKRRNGKFRANVETAEEYRKSFKLPHISSEEGMTIESFENTAVKELKFRKSNVNYTFHQQNTSVIDTNVLKRIVHLENELNNVKTKMGTRSDIDKSSDLPTIEENLTDLDFWEGTSKSTQTTTSKTATTAITTKPLTYTRLGVSMIGNNTQKMTTKPSTTTLAVKQTVDVKSTDSTSHSITQKYTITREGEFRIQNKTMGVKLTNTATSQEDPNTRTNKTNTILKLMDLQNDVVNDTINKIIEDPKDEIFVKQNITTESPTTVELNEAELKKSVTTADNKELEELLKDINLKNHEIDQSNVTMKVRPPSPLDFGDDDMKDPFQGFDDMDLGLD